jgi:hypothetical protein
MSDPFDPLGRLAAHAAQPYDHPAVGWSDLDRHWQRLYADEARLLGHELATEHAGAVAAVGACEAARDDPRRPTDRWGALAVRLARLTARRDALAAELARRDS